MTEPKDLIERLRNWRSGNFNYDANEYSQIPLAVEASYCIQSLTTENAALREKLRYIANGCEGRIDKDSIPALIAKDALTGGDNAEG